MQGVSDSLDRPHVLLLCHRVPFPPDKGDKIRSYRWLKALCTEYDVHLVAFVDDPHDLQHESYLQAICRTCRLFDLDRRRATLRSVRGLLTGSPLTLPYYRDIRVEQWLSQLRQSFPIATVVIYSAAMAQYVLGDRWRDARRAIDFVDVDSDKWMQYAMSRVGPMRWLYLREAKSLARFEGLASRTLDISLFVSGREAAAFERVQGRDCGRVGFVNNGVDYEYFSLDPLRPSPYPDGRATVAFTGAMDYWANIDAVSWFAGNIWPVVRRVRPDTLFFIVGSKPTKEVKKLAGNGIVVTGRVPDVRPYLQHANVVVAPLRIARGIQNKVLEGMAMARPVVVTGKALEGIDAVPGLHLLVADAAEDFSRQVIDVLGECFPDVGPAAREFVARHYSWDKHSARFLGLVRGP